MEVPANEGEGDQDKSDQDSDEQDGSDGDNPAPLSGNDNEGAPNPPTRAARSSISGSSKVHWTLQEDELLREGEETAVLWSDLLRFSFLILDSGATSRHQVDRPRPWQDAVSVQASVHPTQSECHQRRLDSHGTGQKQVLSQHDIWSNVQKLTIGRMTEIWSSWWPNMARRVGLSSLCK